LRDRTTSREDFIFFTDRLATILVEKAMELLPHTIQEVVTPIQQTYMGRKLDAHVSMPSTEDHRLTLRDYGSFVVYRYYDRQSIS
jgi:hypothetical protein